MTVHRKLFVVSLLLPATLVFTACSGDNAPADDGEDSVAAVIQAADVPPNGPRVNVVTEAPTGFDNQSNGVTDEAGFEAALDVFDEVDVIADGLGPCYNAQGCRECHQTPVSGAAAVTGEFRAGHLNGNTFVDHPGGSLLNDRAIDASIQERIAAGQEVRTFRISLSLMGDGFVECTDSNTLVAITNAQPVALRGTVIQVPVLEAPGQIRVGRFGHKNQQASLLSFSADAYVNEVGITSPLQPNENTSNGVSVAGFDTVADPEDDGGDIQLFADFMRSLKAPPRGPITAAVTRGEAIFNSATLQCAICHTPTIVSAPAGTVVNGGAFTCPPALGDKRFHPFSDYALHNVGTGDGIVQNGGQGTRLMVRTPALWGMRARDRLMHDGATVSRSDAIARHGGQAANAAAAFARLTLAQQNDLIDFLNSL